MGEKFSSALGQLCSSALPCQKKRWDVCPTLFVVSSTRSLRLEVLFVDLLEVLADGHNQAHVGLIEPLGGGNESLDRAAVLDDDLVAIQHEVLVDLQRELGITEKADVDLRRGRAVTLYLGDDLLGLATESFDELLCHTDLVVGKGNADLHDIVLLLNNRCLSILMMLLHHYSIQLKKSTFTKKNRMWIYPYGYIQYHVVS